MKKCPTCQRTYTDDSFTHCMHDGTPLMPAQYQSWPPPQQSGQMPQAYPPPPPAGYAPSPGYAPYPGQNYPPPGYAAGTGEYVPCPRCYTPNPEKVKFTWWGGLLGPKMLSHVKCRNCGLTYNGKSGQSNTTGIVIYSVIVFVIFFAIGIALIIALR
jgi:hypothetical protein